MGIRRSGQPPRKSADRIERRPTARRRFHIESLEPRLTLAADLQVVSIARTPEYARWNPNYTTHTVTEPGGYGPYTFTSSQSLAGGQQPTDAKFPDIGQMVTYIATVRNRGDSAFVGNLAASWRLDGVVVAQQEPQVDLSPGAVTTLEYQLSWDDQPHELTFTLDVADERVANNTLGSDPLAVPFLTYIDESFLEKFRTEYTTAPNQNDDLIDWLNEHMTRFNELFKEAGVDKRVHYGVLQVLPDGVPPPPIDTTPYASFPFRYGLADGNPRLSGYYRASEDLDYGLLHEMGHQLGMIDVYQLDLQPESNQATGLGYTAGDGLMRNVAPFLSEFEALSMQHWLREAHGYYGQFMYNLPATMQLRLQDFDGQPLVGATVTAYQLAERPGQGKLISNEVKFTGTTDSSGLLTLPNVDINPNRVPTIATGDTLRDNPFGYVAVVGTNGLLHFRIELEGAVDHAWLDITEANVAYFKGQTDVATFTRQLALGGPVQTTPAAELTEQNARDWIAWAEGASATVADDVDRKQFGQAAIKFTTDGGFDTSLRYPRTFAAKWDLSAVENMSVSFYAHNTTIGFQSGSPWIRLLDGDGNYFEYQYFENGQPADLLNDARDRWRSYAIPLDPPEQATGWRRTAHGEPSLERVQFVEIHADTWESGFELWVDGFSFGRPAAVIAKTPAEVAFQQPVQFDGSASYGIAAGQTIALYEWDFDYDGQTFEPQATGAKVERRFAQYGRFRVALRVSDGANPAQSDIAVVEIEVGFPGDYDLDGDVDLSDFGVLKQTFGQAGGAGDVDGDGDVDLDDFAVIKANFGWRA
jgi:hypothetical protein